MASVPVALLLAAVLFKMAAWLRLYNGARGPLFAGISSLVSGLSVLAGGYAVYRVILLRSPIRDMLVGRVPFVFFLSLFCIVEPIIAISRAIPFEQSPIFLSVAILFLPSVPFLLAYWALKSVRPVSVLFLRSFEADRDEQTVHEIRQIFRFVGRTEALRPPQAWFSFQSGWTLIGHDARWKQGVRRLIQNATLVVVDVSIESDNLDWEIAQLNQCIDVPRVFIVNRRTCSDVAALRERYHVRDDLVSYDGFLEVGFADKLRAAIDESLSRSELSQVCVERNPPLSAQRNRIRALLSVGANVNEMDRNGVTALHHASRVGSSFLVKTLLEHGANVNQICSWGSTPLHRAVIGTQTLEEKSTIIELLLSAGADASITNSLGDRPADYVQDRRITKLLAGT